MAMTVVLPWPWQYVTNHMWKHVSQSFFSYLHLLWRRGGSIPGFTSPSEHFMGCFQLFKVLNLCISRKCAVSGTYTFFTRTNIWIPNNPAIVHFQNLYLQTVLYPRNITYSKWERSTRVLLHIFFQSISTVVWMFQVVTTWQISYW